MTVLLVDTQGTCDQSSVQEWTIIFALGTLLSSVLVYNLHDLIQEDNLQHLQASSCNCLHTQLVSFSEVSLIGVKAMFSCGPINMKFAPNEIGQLTAQNRQMEHIVQSRSCLQSIKNHDNVVLDDRTASTVL